MGYKAKHIDLLQWVIHVKIGQCTDKSDFFNKSEAVNFFLQHLTLLLNEQCSLP
jgi:hypothetical protein